MKTIFAFSLCVLSFSVFACSNISGKFQDEDGEVITIVQTNCEKLDWKDDDNNTTLFADNVERVVEQERDNVAYGKARFTDQDFVLELRVVYSKNAPSDWPTHFLTSYRIDKYNNLVEKIESTQGTSYVTFRRMK